MFGLWLVNALAQSGNSTTRERSKEPANPYLARIIVVYNQNDRDSPALARFYAEQRGIAMDHVIALSCPTGEEMSRVEYDRTIAGPLRTIFRQRGWWKEKGAGSSDATIEGEIDFVALIRGIPLRIAPVLLHEGDEPSVPVEIRSRNDASVDSELAVLGWFSPTISGFEENPYYRSALQISAARHHALLLTCRLDGPTPEIVRGMIADSLAAEREGLDGITYVDARGTRNAGLMEGDQWLLNIADSTKRRGSQVVLDRNEELFSASDPMQNAALYFGWYTGTVSGPMTRPDFRFTRGAVAVHIHSFSAVSIRDPQRFWCGPLLAAGASATLGSVAEPYLTLTPNLDIFHERLRDGFTFAESAWMSQRALSWMTTFVGDPLYRPFPKRKADAKK